MTSRRNLQPSLFKTIILLGVLLTFIALLLLSRPVQARMLHPVSAKTFTTSEPNCSGTSLYSRLPRKFEPSDLVWDPSKQLLYVVSDNGRVAALDNVGTDSEVAAQVWKLGKKFDLEGCTLVPGRTDTIYLGVEYPAAVLEYNLNSSSIIRKWRLESYFDQHPVPADPDSDASEVDTNSGLESLVFVPSSASDWGGYFYVGRQEDARVFVFELPVSEKASMIESELRFRGWIQPPGPGYDLSAMTLWRNHLWLLYDKPYQLLALKSLSILPKEGAEMQMEGATLQAVSQMSFDIRGQEGLAFVEEANGTKWVFIGVDPPKHKGAKDLLRYNLDTFFECFADNGLESIPTRV
ncbi:hypothetical protein SpCBS45565_g02275 [Spizellomyces sp. 'palustris']|nr:hypothetical protein SpCBS45565_g02275 [Spizellomyces sp. 'palustris']